MTTSSPDYAQAYRGVRTGVTELLVSLDDAELDVVAPATPDWRVRDVAAHMAGVCDDIVNGNMSGVTSDAWTAAQVAKRATWTREQLIADWDEHATVIEGQMNDWGPGMGQLVFDAWTHEQDIRGALDVAGGRDAVAAVIAFDWMVSSLQPPDDIDPADPRLRPGINLVTEVGAVVIIGPPPGVDLGPITTLRVSRFEFLRTITGRRSRAQIAALDWDGPPRVDDLCFGEPFHPAVVDLIE